MSPTAEVAEARSVKTKELVASSLRQDLSALWKSRASSHMPKQIHHLLQYFSLIKAACWHHEHRCKLVLQFKHQNLKLPLKQVAQVVFQPGAFAAFLEGSRTSERMVGILEDTLAISLSLHVPATNH